MRLRENSTMQVVSRKVCRELRELCLLTTHRKGKQNEKLQEDTYQPASLSEPRLRDARGRRSRAAGRDIAIDQQFYPRRDAEAGARSDQDRRRDHLRKPAVARRKLGLVRSRSGL